MSLLLKPVDRAFNGGHAHLMLFLTPYLSFFSRSLAKKIIGSFYVVGFWGLMSLGAPHTQALEKTPSAKVPPVSEALIPYAFQEGIQSHLNPVFPMESVSKPTGVTALPVSTLSQKQYQQYVKQWSTLWPSLDAFTTLFTQADMGKDEISVQYLSARIASILLLYHHRFAEAPQGYSTLASFRSLSRLTEHLEELRSLLQVQGRPDIVQRPFQNDLDEEALAYQRYFVQIRQDLAILNEYRDLSRLLTTDFRKTDH